jgi:hypothetical protein
MIKTLLKYFRILLSTSVLTASLQSAYSQQPPGGDSYVFPPGGKAGSMVEVRLGGADWTPDTQFILHHPKARLEVFTKPGTVLMPEPPYWFGIKSYANDPRLPREVSARVVLPADLPPGLIHWSVANANGAGNGGVFVVGNGNEVMEDEERTEPQVLPVIPITVNGRLNRIEEVDRYRFVATQSGPVTCDLMARRLGSDFLGAIEIRDVEGRQIADVVDTEGLDPMLTFQAEKGKAYTVSIRDLDYRGYRNMTYRLTLTWSHPAGKNAKPVNAGFQLRAPGIVNLPIGGGKVPIPIRILREAGFKEPISLRITGLPEGVSLPKELVIPPSVEAFPITLECVKTATASVSNVRIEGTARVGSETITHLLQADFHGDLTTRHPEVNLIPHILVATTMKPPIKAKVAEADGGRRIPRGSTHLSEILIERSDGFQGEVLLDMAGNQQRHRQGIRGPAISVAPGISKIDYPVFLPEWLETSRTSRIGLVAMVQVTDPKGIPRYLMTPVEGQITMSIEGALMKLSCATDDIRGRAGFPLQIPLKLSRSKVLTEPVLVELIAPPRLAGTLSAKPITWPRNDATGVFEIESVKDRKLTGPQVLTIRATTMKDQHPVVSETTIEVLWRQ